MKLSAVFCFLAGILSVGNCALIPVHNADNAVPKASESSNQTIGNSVAANLTPTPQTGKTIAPGQTKQGAKSMKDSEILEDLVETFADAERKGFIQLEKAEHIPAQALADSRFWSSNFFINKANPHQQPEGNVKYGAHLATDDTIDLLRFEYQVGELALSIIEARQATLIRVKPPADLTAQTIDRIAYQILRMQYEKREGDMIKSEDVIWKFEYPSSINEKSRFSTALDKEPFGGASWRTVVDGGIQDGKLFFLCYKKNTQLSSFQGNPKKWFDEDFRSGWQRRPN